MKLGQEHLHPQRTALIIVDVQNDFCHPEGSCARRGSDVSAVPVMMPNLHALLDGARAHGVPVIFIQTFHEAATDSASWTLRSNGRSGETCRTGTWGADFFEVSPAPGEIIVNKHRYSAFINTRLDSVLRTLNTETIVMTGVATNVCVESTARDGYMLDYNVAFVKDACAAFSKKAHDMTLENIDNHFGTVFDSNQIVNIWEAIAEAGAHKVS
ncbi:MULTISPECIES: isochorismatase family cysteine hydrolase [unclassified Paenibacillus]|uniref:cysteine hydrolase family protein n=1 Tax=unclassified Paenibacillus TaxID=185978 RepID=UPI002406AC54|nr:MULTISPECIES: isochorismatase family cysteine hydrolase [unclassified Paenibacillus]MDF9839763.1 ureidoacrylate peracid hydrolase [Paenibacillus sp. PastF-2]MDF9846343.1 ureidoacrylate peracid hydrolase [Paenibacillus sp. PastM-2]MDF9853307.1 ureidoacrylate peracid hydrolase [Paenibacillus sp. PastF-1]MDH6478189.1 ureidoacrylate peracid hydrolase [Paenibacillus sp. PastH-2]MDH6506312.1 ureidoacrylate peracid hydrolase [Paenibacillus sp. PastM-3]